MRFNVAFIGFGIVGQGLAQILVEKKDFLRKKYGFEYNVVAISDLKKGSVLNEEGIDLPKVLGLVEKTSNIRGYEGGQKGLSSVETIEESSANMIVEATWTDLKTAEPGLTHIRKSLAAGKNVVTTNKGPIAVAYHELNRLAETHNVFLRFEGTVLSGTPTLNLTLEDLAGVDIHSVRGIVNGTTNYILTQMEAGNSYEEALKEAQRRGYAEADPTMDVEGWDAVAKAIILANVTMGGDVKVEDVKRTGVTRITTADIRNAQREDVKMKLIAKAWREDGKVKAKVAPEKVPLSDILAHINGSLNALTFSTDLLGDLTVVGRGAGGTEAGYALLSDMLAINRRLDKR
jgi:homoserine dehydrogenase